MKAQKHDTKSANKGAKIPVNPFIKAVEEKIAISNAIKEGKPLSALKGIRFAKPL